MNNEIKLEEELGQRHLKEREQQDEDLKVRKELGVHEAQREGSVSGVEQERIL